MGNKQVDPKRKVEDFLYELKALLSSPTFNIDYDLDIILRKQNEDPLDPCTTANTLAALDFDKNDIRCQLLEISVSDYAETIIDIKDPSSPPFFTFFRRIQSRDVYIKVKIKERQSKQVFCISFHYTKYPISRPLPYEF